MTGKLLSEPQSGSPRLRPRTAPQRLSATQRCLIERGDVNVSAIEHTKTALAIAKGQEQIGSAEEHDLGTEVPAQVLAGGKEYMPLAISYAARGCHLAVILVHLIE